MLFSKIISIKGIKGIKGALENLSKILSTILSSVRYTGAKVEEKIFLIHFLYRFYSLVEL